CAGCTPRGPALWENSRTIWMLGSVLRPASSINSKRGDWWSASITRQTVGASTSESHRRDASCTSEHTRRFSRILSPFYRVGRRPSAVPSWTSLVMSLVLSRVGEKKRERFRNEDSDSQRRRGRCRSHTGHLCAVRFRHSGFLRNCSPGRSEERRV